MVLSFYTCWYSGTPLVSTIKFSKINVVLTLKFAKSIYIYIYIYYIKQHNMNNSVNNIYNIWKVFFWIFFVYHHQIHFIIKIWHNSVKMMTCFNFDMSNCIYKVLNFFLVRCFKYTNILYVSSFKEKFKLITKLEIYNF